MSKKALVQRGFFLALCNLAIAASLGLLLRYFFVGQLSGFNFKYILHAHSHVGMLGWLFSGLYIFLFWYFVPENARLGYYRKLFIAIQLAVLGMLLSFPFQGYAAVSIAFSTLHIILSYVFVNRILKDSVKSNTLSSMCMRTALFFMCFSTIGVWLLGIVMAKLGRESPWYDMAIQFFLHFQFNGWFVFGALALVFKQLDHLFIPVKLRNAFLYTLIAATLLTYAQVVVPEFRIALVLWADGVGVHLQLAALLLLGYILFRTGDLLVPSTRKTENLFLRFILLVYSGKVALQYAMFFLDVGFDFTLNRYLSVGFIHLTLLGVFTLLLAVAYSSVFARFTPVSTVAWKVFTLGFILSEGLIFYQGLGFFPVLEYYHQILFGVSALMTLGVWVALVNFISTISKARN